MSMLSNQVMELREFGRNRKLDVFGYDEVHKIMLQAAETIEALSKKLSAANMERSDRYYGEELKEAKETIRKLLCSEYGSSCQFCIQDNNENAMCRKVGGSGSWCCENAAWNGKSD